MRDIYDYPLYRPPSEAYSLIIQVTLGCSHNHCVFCTMYQSKKFIIRSFEDIKKDLDLFSVHYKNIDRIFLADGDALICPTELLVQVLDYIKITFPRCERVSVYATPIAIAKKSLEELKLLRSKGLKLMYLGVESGDNATLRFIKKGITHDKLVEYSAKIREAGIQLSATYIAGILGVGTDNTMHAVNTGKIISEMSPDYVGIVTLVLKGESELVRRAKEGLYQALDPIDVLKEIKMMIENIDPEIMKYKSFFRSNHVSNYLNLKGILPDDKDRLLSEIVESINKNKISINKYRHL